MEIKLLSECKRDYGNVIVRNYLLRVDKGRRGNIMSLVVAKAAKDIDGIFRSMLEVARRWVLKMPDGNRNIIRDSSVNMDGGAK